MQRQNANALSNATQAPTFTTKPIVEMQTTSSLKANIVSSSRSVTKMEEDPSASALLPEKATTIHSHHGIDGVTPSSAPAFTPVNPPETNNRREKDDEMDNNDVDVDPRVKKRQQFQQWRRQQKQQPQKQKTTMMMTKDGISTAHPRTIPAVVSPEQGSDRGAEEAASDTIPTPLSLSVHSMPTSTVTLNITRQSATPEWQQHGLYQTPQKISDTFLTENTAPQSSSSSSKYYSPVVMTPSSTTYMNQHTSFKSSMDVLDERLRSVKKMEGKLDSKIGIVSERMFEQPEEGEESFDYFDERDGSSLLLQEEDFHIGTKKVLGVARYNQYKKAQMKERGHRHHGLSSSGQGGKSSSTNAVAVMSSSPGGGEELNHRNNIAMLYDSEDDDDDDNDSDSPPAHRRGRGHGRRRGNARATYGGRLRRSISYDRYDRNSSRRHRRGRDRGRSIKATTEGGGGVPLVRRRSVSFDSGSRARRDSMPLLDDTTASSPSYAEFQRMVRGLKSNHKKGAPPPTRTHSTNNYESSQRLQQQLNQSHTNSHASSITLSPKQLYPTRIQGNDSSDISSSSSGSSLYHRRGRGSKAGQRRLRSISYDRYDSSSSRHRSSRGRHRGRNSNGKATTIDDVSARRRSVSVDSGSRPRRGGGAPLWEDIVSSPSYAEFQRILDRRWVGPSQYAVASTTGSRTSISTGTPSRPSPTKLPLHHSQNNFPASSSLNHSHLMIGSGTAPLELKQLYPGRISEIDSDSDTSENGNDFVDGIGTDVVSAGAFLDDGPNILKSVTFDQTVVSMDSATAPPAASTAEQDHPSKKKTPRHFVGGMLKRIKGTAKKGDVRSNTNNAAPAATPSGDGKLDQIAEHQGQAIEAKKPSPSSTPNVATSTSPSASPHVVTALLQQHATSQRRLQHVSMEREQLLNMVSDLQVQLNEMTQDRDTIQAERDAANKKSKMYKKEIKSLNAEVNAEVNTMEDEISTSLHMVHEIHEVAAMKEEEVNELRGKLKKTKENMTLELAEVETKSALALEEKVGQLATSHAAELEELKRKLRMEAEEQRLAEIDRVRTEMEASSVIALKQQSQQLAALHSAQMEELRTKLDSDQNEQVSNKLIRTQKEQEDNRELIGRLKSEIESLKEEKSSLELKNKEATLELEAAKNLAESRLELVMQENINLSNEVEGMHKIIAELEAQKVSLETNVSDCEEKTQTLSAEFTALENEAESNGRQILDLESQLASALREADTLRRTVTSHEDTLGELRTEMHLLDKQKADVEGSLTELHFKIDDVVGQRDGLARQLEQAIKELECLRVERNDLFANVADTSVIQNLSNDSFNEISVVGNEMEESHSHNYTDDSPGKELREILKVRSLSEEDIGKLSARMSQAQTMISRFEQERTLLKKEVNYLRAKLECSQGELTTAKEEYQKIREHSSALCNVVGQARSLLERTEEEKNQMALDLENAQKSMKRIQKNSAETYNTIVTKSQDEINKLKMELEQKNESIKFLKSSSSVGRKTGPLDDLGSHTPNLSLNKHTSGKSTSKVMSKERFKAERGSVFHVLKDIKKSGRKDKLKYRQRNLCDCD